MRLDSVRLVSWSELREELAQPWHVLDFVTEPGGSPGQLIMDATMCALCIDAVLGGDGKSLPQPAAGGFTFAQRALMSRVADGVMAAFSDAFVARTGLRLARLASRSADAIGESTRVVCTCLVGEEGAEGRLLLCLEKDALLQQVVSHAPKEGADPRVVRTLEDVEVDVVVELGRLRMPLSDLPKLAVGNTLAIDLAVDGEVRVVVAHETIAYGRPTRVGDRVAVRLR